MKKKVENNGFLRDLIYKYLCSNPLFKIYIGPIVVITALAIELHNYIIISVVEMEKYLGLDVRCTTPKHIIISYLLWIVSHYLLTFICDCLFVVFLQSAVVSSFKTHVREYLSISHNDFHGLGTGKIHTLIERRTVGIIDFTELLYTSAYYSLVSLCKVYQTLFVKFGHVVANANLVFFLIYIVFCALSSILLYKSRRKANNDYNSVSNRIYGILQNYDVIKAYNNDALEIEKLNKKCESVEHSYYYYDVLCNITKCMQSLLIILPNSLIIYCAINGHYFTAISTFVAFSIYHKQFMIMKTNMEKLGNDAVKFLQSYTDVNDSHIQECYLDDNMEGVDIGEINSSIQFIDFGLLMNGNYLLRNCNFEIKAGEKIAIVGKNGSGKSSLIKVLLRFYDYEGEVRIDDVEMSKINVKSQRKLFSYIPQVPYLIEGPVLKNLNYYNHKLTNEEIRKTCVEYGTHEIFAKLEDGYMTNVGESGKFLSGGQKQQVSFMRGVLKGSDVLLIDEPTANLDAAAEIQLISRIFNQLNSNTVLVILHNFEYLKKFDKIFGFHDNKIQIYDNYNDFIKDQHLY